MIAQYIILMIPPVLLLNLKSRMIHPLPPTQIRQLLQHIPLLPIPREHMRNKYRLAGSQIPHMQIMHINNPIYFLDILLELSHRDIPGRGFHHDVVAVLDDWVGGDEDDDGEDVGGDGVQVVDVVPLEHLLAVVGAGEEDYEG